MRGTDEDVVFRLVREFPPQYEVEAVEVTVEADGLTCRRGVITLAGDGLDTFFSELERDWQGWSGARVWNALEGGMTIEATHTGRRVALVVTLRHDSEPNVWELRLPLSLPPGEPLSEAAADMRAFWAERR